MRIMLTTSTIKGEPIGVYHLMENLAPRTLHVSHIEFLLVFTVFGNIFNVILA